MKVSIPCAVNSTHRRLRTAGEEAGEKACLTVRPVRSYRRMAAVPRFEPTIWLSWNSFRVHINNEKL